MILQLFETIYHFKYDGKILKIVLGIENNAPCVKYVFGDQTIWYLQIKTFQELGQDDLKTIQESKEIFKSDRDRFINPLICDYIANNFENYKFSYKEVWYKFQLHSIDFNLRISIMSNNTFRMQFTNEVNEDIMTCFCEADSFKKLVDNIRIYVDAIEQVTTEIKDNLGNLLDSTFIQVLSTFQTE